MSDVEASDLLRDYLAEQCDQVVAGESALRDGADPDGVHDTRVALRRLRSTIRVFGPLLSPGRARLRALDEDLRWVAGLLGDVRDADVLGRRLHHQLRDLPPELVLGPVVEEVDASVGRLRSEALRRWEECRTHEPEAGRYADTLSTVAAWRDVPPVADSVSDERLAEKGRQLLRKARRTARRRLDEAGHDPAAIHRARKSLKRVRYAADALRPVVPKARKVARRAKRLQRTLGTHQDLVVEMAFLRDQAARYGAQAGHNGFTYGLLLGRAEARAAALRRGLAW